MISLINFTAPTGEGFGWFLAQCILGLAEATASIALAVILFTLILKLITLPADIYSRISTRKNSLIMEKLRPELEKLQKTYANDKTLYQQKVNALYRKHGYSMWGACLPTILTLVIFIIAINAFNDFSKYQNRQYVYDMSLSYNQVIYDGFNEQEYVFYDKDNNQFVLSDELEQKVSESADGEVMAICADGEARAYDESLTDAVVIFKRINSNNQINVDVWTPGGYTKCTLPYSAENGFNDKLGAITFSVIEENLEGKVFTFGEGEQKVTLVFDTFNETAEGKTKGQLFVESACSYASAYTFRESVTSFLWIKNIWVADSAFTHPVESSTSSIAAVESCGSCGCSGCACSSLDDEGWKNSEIESDYQKLISKLDDEMDEPNGYFILVILTAGVSLLLQFISAKSSKAQMELQTVDGQGAMQQKMMMWMMPIMMAIFAFMYTAAFSIYIILSSAISILTTVLINFLVNKKFKKLEEEIAQERNIVRGRVYVAKEEPKQDKKSKKDKKNQIPDNDFLSGKADKKKHIRGRKK